LLASIAEPQVPPGAPLVNWRLVGDGVVVVVVLASVAVVVVLASVVVVGASVVVVGAEVVVVTAPVVVVVGGEVVVLPQGFGSHEPGPRFTPPALEHCVADSTTQGKAPPGEPGRQHWIGASVVVVVLLVDVVVAVVLVVVDVVVEVVVEPTGQRGRPASPVQVQRNALHCFVMFLAQLVPLELGPHASLTSSLQAKFLSHLPLLSAIAEEERKTPTPSATAANNLTTAFLVIVESPIFPFSR